MSFHYHSSRDYGRVERLPQTRFPIARVSPLRAFPHCARFPIARVLLYNLLSTWVWPVVPLTTAAWGQGSTNVRRRTPTWHLGVPHLAPLQALFSTLHEIWGIKIVTWVRTISAERFGPHPELWLAAGTFPCGQRRLTQYLETFTSLELGRSYGVVPQREPRRLAFSRPEQVGTFPTHLYVDSGHFSRRKIPRGYHLPVN